MVMGKVQGLYAEIWNQFPGHCGSDYVGRSGL